MYLILFWFQIVVWVSKDRFSFWGSAHQTPLTVARFISLREPPLEKSWIRPCYLYAACLSHTSVTVTDVATTNGQCVDE